MRKCGSRLPFVDYFVESWPTDTIYFSDIFDNCVNCRSIMIECRINTNVLVITEADLKNHSFVDNGFPKARTSRAEAFPIRSAYHRRLSSNL
jgi:hypothetical protein